MTGSTYEVKASGLPPSMMVRKGGKGKATAEEHVLKAGRRGGGIKPSEMSESGDDRACVGRASIQHVDQRNNGRFG
jgi:hypothetical protein